MHGKNLINKMNQPNPNGANQYQMDPRQKLCWESYINPRSETFGNATQSAIKAGYEPDYADQMTTVEWFKGKVRRLNMLGKAEKVLDETLDYIAVNEEGKVDAAVGRLKLDAAKVIATTLGKDEGYSTRSEVTGANGEALTINLVNYEDGDDTSQLPETDTIPN
jgi:hypothetical protein